MKFPRPHQFANTFSAVRSTAIVLFAGVVFFAAGDGATRMAYANSPQISVVRLSCPAAPVELCRAAMRTIVTESNGRFDVRLVEEADVAPSREGDLGMTLRLDGQGPGWISAYFDWQAGPNGNRGRGASVEMSVMDTAMSSEMYTRFIQELLQTDAGLRALLACKG